MKYFVTNGSENLVAGSKDLLLNSSGEMKQIKVYPAITYQTILGMGAAFTEAAAYTWSKMSAGKKKRTD